MASRIESAIGAEQGKWSHRSPLEHLGDLLPVAVGGLDKPSVTLQTNQKTTASLMQGLHAVGCHISNVSLPIYGSSGMGKARHLDNSDLIAGHGQLFDDVPHLRDVVQTTDKAVTALGGYLSELEKKDPKSLIPSMCLQDLNKVTIQRGKYFGWWLQQPVADFIRRTGYAPEHVNLMGIIMREYMRCASKVHRVPQTGNDWMKLILLDSDPADTMVGLPTLASGANTHQARIATLQCLLSPAQQGVTPAAWLDHYSRVGMRLGMPENMAFAGVQSTRYGPTRKPIDLWYSDGLQMVSTYNTVGYLPRIRLVYPAPYPINFVLSPLYVMFSEARKQKLGLWHDPVSMTQYIQKLKQQGKKTYTVDFSGMDTSMPPHLIQMIAAQALAAGFPAWPCQLLSELMTRTGVVSPSYAGNPTEVTYITKMFPWMSGFKLTSEMDTIFGMWTILIALSPQIPGVVQKWLSGDFVICELGDDICFTTDVELDMGAVADVAMKECGASLKILDDALFLKKMLPIHPSVPQLTKPIARVLQQSLFNESSYVTPGVGEQPDEMLRLGLVARMDTVAAHPHFKDMWPMALPPLLKLGYVQRSSAEFVSSLKLGKPVLSRADVLGIYEFTSKAPNYMSELLNRAKFEPSAAGFLDTLKKNGLNVGSLQSPENAMIRKMYMEALSSTPSAQSMQDLIALARWSPNAMAR